MYVIILWYSNTARHGRISRGTESRRGEIRQRLSRVGVIETRGDNDIASGHPFSLSHRFRDKTRRGKKKKRKGKKEPPLDARSRKNSLALVARTGPGYNRGYRPLGHTVWKYE